MANFEVSNLVKAQTILNERFGAPEMRDRESTVLALGRRNAEIMIPSHTLLRTREDRPITAYILKRNKRTTTGAGRVNDHTGAIGDSISADISWTTFADTFSMSLKLLDNNMFDAATVLANQFAQCFQNIRADVEQFLIDYLVAARTQVNAATANGTWDNTNFIFGITDPYGKPGLYFEDMKSMMRQNNYSGMVDLIADPTLYTYARIYAAQGAQNAVNTAFQFSGMDIRESIGFALPNLMSSEGAALTLPQGTFGVLDWIPRQNRQGSGDYNDYNGGYGSMTDPVSGMTFAIHGYSQRADTSASNGSAQDNTIEFEVSIDLSPNLAPLSNATESVVFASKVSMQS